MNHKTSYCNRCGCPFEIGEMDHDCEKAKVKCQEVIPVTEGYEAVVGYSKAFYAGNPILESGQSPINTDAAFRLIAYLAEKKIPFMWTEQGHRDNYLYVFNPFKEAVKEYSNALLEAEKTVLKVGQVYQHNHGGRAIVIVTENAIHPILAHYDDSRGWVMDYDGKSNLLGWTYLYTTTQDKMDWANTDELLRLCEHVGRRQVNKQLISNSAAIEFGDVTPEQLADNIEKELRCATGRKLSPELEKKIRDVEDGVMRIGQLVEELVGDDVGTDELVWGDVTPRISVLNHKGVEYAVFTTLVDAKWLAAWSEGRRGEGIEVAGVTEWDTKQDAQDAIEGHIRSLS